MLIIRTEQREAFESVARERYIREMMDHLRDVFPGEPVVEDDETLRSFIELKIEQAASLNITGEKETAMFIDLELDMETSEDYSESRDWIRETLEDQELDQSVKLNLIYVRLRSEAGSS